MKTIIYGVATYEKDKINKGCPYFSRWRDMISRAYDTNLHQRFPTYKDVSVCKDWLEFEKFKMWMETKEFKELYLDKDIIKIGNKEYSPDLCWFVPSYINNLILTRDKSRGLYSLGVSKTNLNGYEYFVSKTHDSKGKTKYAYRKSEIESHRVWQLWKAQEIHQRVSFWYKDSPLSFHTKVAESLIDRSWRIMIDHGLGKETVLI